MIIPFKKKSPVIDDSCFVAENSTVIGDVKIGAKSSVWFGAVIRGDMASVTIGEKTNIQDNATVHVGLKPCKIGSGVTVGHNAVVHSATIGDNVLVGMGSVVLDEAVIGENSIIGAGAVVTGGTVIPPNSLVVGTPAKVVKEVGLTQRASTKMNAAAYVQLAEKYKKGED